MISEQLPDEGSPLPGYKRRRRPTFGVFWQDDRGEFIEKLAKQYEPSFDYFWLAFVAGILFSIGNLTNSPGILILAGLFCANLYPALGMGFALSIKSIKDFGTNLGAVLVGILFTLICGWIGSWISHLIIPDKPVYSFPTTNQTPWDLLFLLVVSICFAEFYSIKQNQLARIGLIGIGYVIFGQANLLGISIYLSNWDSFFFHGLWLITTFMITIAFVIYIIQALKIIKQDSNILVIAILFTVFSISIILVNGAGIRNHLNISPSMEVIPSRTMISTDAIVIRTTTTSPFPKATATLRPTSTMILATIPSKTPEPILMIVRAEGQRGARLRKTAGLDGIVLDVLVNGMTVTYLNEYEVNDEFRWLKIVTNDGKIGWMVNSALSSELIATVVPVSPTVTITN